MSAFTFGNLTPIGVIFGIHLTSSLLRFEMFGFNFIYPRHLSTFWNRYERESKQNEVKQREPDQITISWITLSLFYYYCSGLLKWPTISLFLVNMQHGHLFCMHDLDSLCLQIEQVQASSLLLASDFIKVELLTYPGRERVCSLDLTPTYNQ